MKNKLTYDKIIELVNLGRELCPYVRNPTYRERPRGAEVRGHCVLTNNTCLNGLEQSCDYKLEFWREGLHKQSFK
jgi:hypothetical protein